MGVNSLPKTVTRQRRDCDLDPGSSATEPPGTHSKSGRQMTSGSSATRR